MRALASSGVLELASTLSNTQNFCVVAKNLQAVWANVIVHGHEAHDGVSSAITGVRYEMWMACGRQGLIGCNRTSLTTFFDGHN
jgi:hypothetical protein